MIGQWLSNWWKTGGGKTARNAIKGAFRASLDAIAAFILSVFDWLYDVVAATGRMWWNFKTNPFGMLVYGTSLLTTKARWSIRVFAVVLSIQFVIDFVAWGAFGAFAFPVATYGATVHYLAAVVVGWLFATAILAFDLTVVTLDTGRSKKAYWPLFARGMILVGISFITAIPFEMGVYGPTITNNLENRQKVAVDAIRVKAIAEEQGIYAKKANVAKEDLVKISEGYALLNNQLSAYRHERKNATQSKSSDMEKQRTLIGVESGGAKAKVSIDGVQQSFGTGERGCGPRCKALKEDLRFMEEDLRKFEAETAAGIKAREAALADKSKSDEVAGKARLTAIQSEHEKIVAALRIMPPAEIALKYGGEWKQTFDFLTRFDEMTLMAQKNPRVNHMTWIIRLALIAIGLLILFLKAMCPEELMHYFAFRSQAAFGALTDVVDQAQNQGYTDSGARKALGYTPAVRKLLEDLSLKRGILADACLAYQVEAVECFQATHNGFPTLAKATKDAKAAWKNIVLDPDGKPRRHPLRDADAAEEACRLNGIPVPTWPAAELGVDPRTLVEPWNLTQEQAIALGWRDPEPQRQGNFVETVADARHKLAQAYAEYHGLVFASVLARSGGLMPTRAAISAGLKVLWKDLVASAIHTLNKAEREAGRNHAPVPPWPADFGPDPRNENEPWTLSADQLKKMGWEDPDVILTRLTAAKANLVRNRRTVTEAAEEVNTALAGVIRSNPGETADRIAALCEEQRAKVWRERVRPAMRHIGEAEDAILECGQNVPEWRGKNGTDTGPMGWRVFNEMLIDNGWVMPTPPPPPPPEAVAYDGTPLKVVIVLNAIARHRRTVRNAIDELNLELVDTILKNPGASAAEIIGKCNPRRFAVWRRVIIAALRQIAEAEEKLRSYGREAEKWDGLDGADPIMGWKLTQDVLVKHGWMEPLPPTTIPAAVTPPGAAAAVDSTATAVQGVVPSPADFGATPLPPPAPPPDDAVPVPIPHPTAPAVAAPAAPPTDPTSDPGDPSPAA